MTGGTPMWPGGPPCVLVGVDRGGSEAALQYAVGEALLRNADLHLVHVCRSLGPSRAGGTSHGDTRLRDRAHHLLRDAADRVHELIGDETPGRVPSVSVELSHGSTVGVLEALSRRADLVVLQHHGWNPNGESSTLSVTAGVAAVAHAPVAAVPDSWRSARRLARVVGLVEDPWRDRAVLEEALLEARRRDVDAVALQVVRRDLEEPTLFGATSIPLTVVCSDESPAEPIAELLHEDDLVVVGRHHRKHVVGAPLGRTARELVRHLAVPVIVVELHPPGTSEPPTSDTSSRRPAWT